MANNRLYITDSSGNKYCIARSIGHTWYVDDNRFDIDKINEFFSKCEDRAMYGSSDEKTELYLITENDPLFDKINKDRKLKEITDKLREK